MVVMRPPSTSSVNGPTTLSSRSRTIAPRLAVDLAWLHSRVDLGEHREDRGEHACHVVSADHHLRERGRIASPIPDHLDIGSEQLPHSVDVIPEGIEEPRRQLLAFPAIRLEIPLTRSEIPMSQIAQLASGPTTAVDVLTIELVETDEHPTVVIIGWPDKPSVIHPRRFPDTASIVVRLFAEAYTTLAGIKSRRPL
jgi:hypothetical protein